jgi:two-component system response regulator AtoC
MARLAEEMSLWRSARMREIRHMIEQAARVDVTVLIQGETGTGKEVVARAIHHLSTRRQHPFVKVNCAAVPTELLESELFGHERGAFTGAHQLKVGTFEAANRGTVFLDEIGDLYPPLQAKLLHVLQDGAFSRVGGRATIRTDVRILAATNQDLERAVAAGRFREDLYYRLNVIQIDVPPLRERTEEILPLVDYFVRRYARIFNREGFTLAPSALDRLLTHRYRGNVRELENLIQRSIVLNDPLLLRVSLPESSASAPVAAAPPPAAASDTASLKDIARQAARAAEREAIGRVLAETGWNRMRAAKLLRISYRALLYKLKEIDLQPRRAS